MEFNWKKPDELPKEKSGWFLAVLKPLNHKELDEKKTDYRNWMNRFGLEKVWYNDGVFWHCGYRDSFSHEINDRILRWCELPDLLKDMDEL